VGQRLTRSGNVWYKKWYRPLEQPAERLAG
jgi:hypothetical protein